MNDKGMNGIYKSLVRLAVPIVCQNFITYGVTLADNLMVGRLGEAAINGLFMAAIIQLVLQMILGGIENSMLVLSTQYWGKKDTMRIKDVVAISTRAAFAVSVAAFAVMHSFPEKVIGLLTSSDAAVAEGARYLKTVSFSYLPYGVSAMMIGAMRSVEVVRIGLLNSAIAFVLNISLNWLLIFGKMGLPAMGVEGAALATDISRLVEFGIALFFLLRIDDRLKMRPRDFFRQNREMAKDLIRYGSPIMAGQLVWAINKFTMRYIVGHFAPASSAAVSISENLDGLLWVGTFGLAAAMGVITGKMIGSGERERVKAYARRMQLVFAGIGLFSFLLVILAGDFFISLYNLAPDTISAARTFLIVLSFSVLGRSYQAPCLMGLVKAGGDTSFVFKNDFFWVFCWVLPSALIAWRIFNAPDWVVYSCLLSDQITKCLVAYVKINRFNWMRNLTR